MKSVGVDTDGRLLTVRPASVGMSLSSPDAVVDLDTLWEELSAEEQVLAVVLVLIGVAAETTSGERSVDGRDAARGADPMRKALVDCVESLATTPHITVAVIHDTCTDEDLWMAIGCDLRVAGPELALGLPGVRDGVVPDRATIRRLVSLVGRSRASDLLLTGRMIDTATAAAWGLVDAAPDGMDPLEAAHETARTICQGAPLAMRYAKEAVDRGTRMPLHDGLGLEGDLYAILQTTNDRLEGIKAFQEHRSPRFEGR